MSTLFEYCFIIPESCIIVNGRVEHHGALNIFTLF